MRVLVITRVCRNHTSVREVHLIDSVPHKNFLCMAVQYRERGMRIAIVAHEATRTGAPEVAARLRQHLSDCSTLIYIRPGDRALQPDDVVVCARDCASTEAVAQCQTSIRNLSVDFVCCISMASYEAALACVALGIPYVLCVYESPSDVAHLQAIAGASGMGVVMQGASLVIFGAHEEGYGKQLRAMIDPCNKLLRARCMMPPFVAPSQAVVAATYGGPWPTNEAGCAYDPNSGRKVALTVATWCTRKGAQLLERCARANPEWDFVWIGAWVGLARNGRMPSNMYFSFEAVVDPFSFARVLRNHTAIFLLPSLQDPSPMSVPEAQYAGMFVVCFRSAGDGWRTVVEGCGEVLDCERDHEEAELNAFLNRYVPAAQVPIGTLPRTVPSIEAFAQTVCDAAGVSVAARRHRRILLHAHVGYGGQALHDIAAHAANLPDATVVCTTHDEALMASIRDEIPGATVLLLANAGADIGPFFHVLREEETAGRAYDFIVKIHTKGDMVVRREHLRALLGTPTIVEQNLRRLESDPSIGMLGCAHWVHPVGLGGMQDPPRHAQLARFLEGELPSVHAIWDRIKACEVVPSEYRARYPDMRHMGDDDARAHWSQHGKHEHRIPSYACMDRLDVPKFVGGTMFWARAEPLFEICNAAAHLTFEAGYTRDTETTPVCSTTHMAERLLGYGMRARGFNVVGIDLNADDMAQCESLWNSILRSRADHAGVAETCTGAHAIDCWATAKEYSLCYIQGTDCNFRERLIAAGLNAEGIERCRNDTMIPKTPTVLEMEAEDRVHLDAMSGFDVMRKTSNVQISALERGRATCISPFSGSALDSTHGFPVSVNGHVAVFYMFREEATRQTFFLALGEYAGVNILLFLPCVNTVIFFNNPDWGDRRLYVRELLRLVVTHASLVRAFIKDSCARTAVITNTTNNMGHTLWNEMCALANYERFGLMKNVTVGIDYGKLRIRPWTFLDAPMETQLLLTDAQALFVETLRRKLFVVRPARFCTAGAHDAILRAARNQRSGEAECVRASLQQCEIALWVNVRDGRTKTWVEQVDGIVRVARRLCAMFRTVGLVLDGANACAHVAKQIMQAMVGTQGIRIHNTFSVSFLDAAEIAQCCHMYIATLGTALFIPTWFTDMRGIAIGDHGHIHQHACNLFQGICPKTRYIAPIVPPREMVREVTPGRFYSNFNLDPAWVMKQVDALLVRLPTRDEDPHPPCS